MLAGAAEATRGEIGRRGVVTWDEEMLEIISRGFDVVP